MRSIKNAFCISMVAAIAIVGMSIGTAGASVKPRQALANVTIANSTSSIVNLPLWVGQSEGLFAAQGLNVKIVSLTAATVTSALLSNSVNFLTSSSTTFLAARGTGSPVEAVYADAIGSPVGLILGTAFAAEHGITTKTPLKTVAKDMIGSTGGSSAASTTGQGNIFLGSYGVEPSQVKVATLSSPAADETALQKGQIDWFVTSEPVPFQAQALGFGIVVATPLNEPAWSAEKTGIGQLLMATTAFTSANPGLVRKVVRSTEAAAASIRKHEQQVITVAQANLPGISRNILFNSLRDISWPLPTKKMNANLWRTTIAYDVKEGVVAHGFKVAESVDWTNKFD